MTIQVTVAANEELPDGVVLRTLAKAQALARRYTGDRPETSVDAFLNNRRADSGE